ncbi:hypothetical protein ACFLVX_04080 [Chloroflexota bacterium]
MSKKEKAFALFDEGMRPSSSAVKSLRLKPKTTYNYYQEWKLTGNQVSQPTDLVEEGKEEPRRGLATPLPGGEWIAPISEVAMKRVTDGEAKNGETEESESSSVSPPPIIVHGVGLTVTVEISVKTLMLYQIAASRQQDELTFGDFIDTCVEDFYLGRGLDLGLIRIGGK